MSALDTFLGLPLVYRLGLTLLHFLWQGTVLALLLAGELALLRSPSANLRYGSACVVLLLMVLFPIATFCFVNVPADPLPPGRRTLDNPPLAAAMAPGPSSEDAASDRRSF